MVSRSLFQGFTSGFTSWQGPRPDAEGLWNWPYYQAFWFKSGIGSLYRSFVYIYIYMTHIYIYILLASNNIFAHDVELLTWQVPRKSALATTSQVANHMPKTFINKVPTRVWRVSQKSGINMNEPTPNVAWTAERSNQQTRCVNRVNKARMFFLIWLWLAMIGYDWLWLAMDQNL